ncbi:helix-turn-helix domain-containing protein [Brachybacterium sp. DNPG3]
MTTPPDQRSRPSARPPADIASSADFASSADIATEGPGLWARRGAPPHMETMHRHDDVEINAVLHGELRYLFAGRPLVVREGEIAVFWAAQPHGLVDSQPGDACWVHVPFATVLGWGLPEADTAPLLRASPLVVHAPELAARTALLAEDWSREITAEGERIALLEIQATLRRILRAGPRPPGPTSGTGPGATVGAGPGPGATVGAGPGPTPGAGSGPTAGAGPGPNPTSGAGTTTDGRLQQVGAMARFVMDRHRDPIAVADIAAAVHLTPSHAMTVFRRTVGVTLGQYVTMCRVADAQRLLLTTSLTTAEIAATSGFGSLSSFYQHMTAACGMSPREYRRQGR